VDFETHRIERRPDYPPIPVGVSIYTAGQRRPQYYAWGHPDQNNCTKAAAVAVLKKIWADPTPKLFYNAKFDLDVAETHLGLPPLAWDQVHDTMFLTFLHNPHAVKLDLKSLADLLLAEPPEERDELKAWILAHVFISIPGGAGSVVVARSKPPGFFRVPPSQHGAFIAHAPGKLVGRYADGDTGRTKRLFDHLYPYIVDHGMLQAYDRERRLMPVLLKSERQGVSVDHKKLRGDLTIWEQGVIETDRWISRRLKTPGLEVDKAEQLANAIERCGKVDEWVLTATGKRSTAKDNLIECVTDKSLVEVLGYRALLVNALRNFGRPWLGMADRSGGRIYTNWNQVRSTDGAGKGARTGRLSSNPNFQNVAKRPEEIRLPAALARAVPPLPFLREYIVPRRGCVILDRDYSQQELRILGHYEGGVLLRAYKEDPFLDLHAYAVDLINDLLHSNFGRYPIKTMGFGLIYGMGQALLAQTMQTDITTAKQLKKAYLQIFPGLSDLISELQDVGKSGAAIRTWGGREYHVEPPKFSKKLRKLQTFEYKLLNVLIQGSAADCTKEAIIRADAAVSHETNFMLSVHDQLVFDTPKKMAKSEMSRIREAIESVEFDIPMLSDGKTSARSWGALTDTKELKTWPRKIA
jgi:DNA polymerase I-like protein with 3'-5' exonuclease and polymerase domains